VERAAGQRLRKPHVPAFGGSILPTKPIWLWGEVLAINKREREQYVTLLDSKNDRAALDASLPVEIAVQIGEMICIEGRLEHRVDGACSLRFQLRGERVVESRGLSRRVNARRQLVGELRRLDRPAFAKRPVRSVVLVSSLGSKAVRDFESALERNLRGATAPRLERLHVALDRPDDIARGIRRAGMHLGAELIVVIRGGGNAISLLPFSTEEVTLAVAQVARQRPLMLAVGHAEDVVVAGEFAAWDLDTPTAAGERVASLCRPTYVGPRRADPTTVMRPAASAMTSPATGAVDRRRLWRKVFASRMTWAVLLLLVLALAATIWLVFDRRMKATSGAVPTKPEHVVSQPVQPPAAAPPKKRHQHHIDPAH
jgi:hypothetical protein